MLPWPLAAYCPGELQPQGSADDKSLVQEFGRLQRAGFSDAWLTHLTPERTAEAAILAAPYGLQIIAAPSILDVTGLKQAWKRNIGLKYYEDSTREVLRAWNLSGAPPPRCWVLGDEPTPDILEAYDLYAKTWRRLSSEPITCVVTRESIVPYGALGLDYLTHNTYPFRKKGGFPDGPIPAWLTNCRETVRVSRTAWAMGQAVSSPEYFDQPTIAQLLWQANSALTLGCRGFIAFLWATTSNEEGLVSLRQFPSQYLDQLGLTFRRIRSWLSRYPELATAAFRGSRALPGPEGSVAGEFQGKSKMVYVLATCGSSEPARLKIPVAGRQLVDLQTGQRTTVLRKLATVSMSAGEGRAWKVSR